MFIKSFVRPFLYSNHGRLAFLSIRSLSSKADDPEVLPIWEGHYQRGVPRTMEEMCFQLRQPVDSPPDARLLKVAIVGEPNCGKSTLINSLMGWRVCSVSSKVHNTRINARAVLNQDSTQLVFLDTPGLVTPIEVSKFRLDRTHLTEAEMSLQNADLMAVVHDISNHYTCNTLHPRALRLLALHPTIPSILVLNKLDKVKSKRKLLEAARLLTDGVVGGRKSHKKQTIKSEIDKEAMIAKALKKDRLNSFRKQEKELAEEDNPHINDTGAKCKKYTEEDVLEGRIRLTDIEVLEFIKDRRGWPKFKNVFMISALQQLGVDELRNYFFDSSSKAPWIFSSQVVTDQNPEEIALMTVREKFLETFKNEIPYEIKFTIEDWGLTESDLLEITIRAACKREGLVRVVVGGGGVRIGGIAVEAEQELRNTFHNEVKLRINVVYDASLK